MVINTAEPDDGSVRLHNAFDKPLGATESVVALPSGFRAAFTALPPVHLIDGEDDAVVVRVTQHTAEQ